MSTNDPALAFAAPTENRRDEATKISARGARMRVGVHMIEAPRGRSGGVQGPPGSISDQSFLHGYARHAEEVGFDSLWLSEHVVNPVHYTSPYPFADLSDNGQMVFPFDTTAFPDPLITLASVAAVTHRIALCSSVIILPTRNPIVLAKQAATLDALAQGRLELGVGLGWWREEVEAVAGVDNWRRRGPMADEMLEVMRRLWTEDEAAFDGEFFSFPPVRCDPKPARPGGVHLLIGGASPVGARRAGRFGDGFVPHPPGPESDRLVDIMRQAASDAGRDPAAIELVAMVPDGDPGRVHDLEELGFDHVYLTVNGPTLDDARRALDAAAERFLTP